MSNEFKWHIYQSADSGQKWWNKKMSASKVAKDIDYIPVQTLDILKAVEFTVPLILYCQKILNNMIVQIDWFKKVFKATVFISLFNQVRPIEIQISFAWMSWVCPEECF